MSSNNGARSFGALPGNPELAEASARAELTTERIRIRAYEIYLGRNGGPGDHLSDWAAAERELTGDSKAVGVVVRQRRDRLPGRAPVGARSIRDGVLDNHD